MDRICRSLVSAGHQVTLLGRRKADSAPLPTDRPYRLHRLSLRFDSGKLFYLEYNYRLWRWLKTQSFDALNSVDLDSLLGGFLALRATQGWVFDAHEYYSATPEVVRRPVVAKIWRRLGKWLVPQTKRRYTVGPRLAELLEAEYGVPFGVVRNLPIRRPPPASGEHADRQKIILYQGMLNEGRGLETAVAGLRQLPKEYTLWLVGNGDLFEVLQSSHADLLAAGRLWMPGFVPPNELPAITAQAWLGLNLLDPSSPSYYYSLANKAFDYIQSGLPSIQMDFPEYRAIQDEHGCFYLLSTLKTEPLVKLILSAADDAEQYNRVQVANVKAAEELCWGREEKNLLAQWKW